MSRAGLPLATRHNRFMRFFAAGLLTASLVSAQTRNIVVYPKETHDLLNNPNMGIETFQRFNNQAIYPGLRWSEVGPAGPVDDSKDPVNFPRSTVAYLRWFWSQLEPERGKYRWDIIDTAITEARRHNQTLAFRMMPYDRGTPLPEWFRNSGAKRTNKPTDQDGQTWSPDSADPLYITAWGELVKQAGRRYDGSPYIDSVDISTFGYWGEGWGPYPPAWSVQKELIDQYFDAFPRTKLLMNFDVLEGLVYATKRGAGWRLDCWGDMGRPGHENFKHMLDLYPEQIARGGLQDVWQQYPVSLETCGTPGSWAQWGFDLKPILDQALRWHASTISIKSTAIPEQWKKEFDEFQKQIGYRFALRRFEYPARIKAGTMAPVKMWWLNAGIAPTYRHYDLALELRSDTAASIVRIPSDVRKWLPGDSVYEDTIYIDDSLKPGNYRVRVALLDPRTGRPAIALAIEGRQADGWYDVGAVEVQ